MLLLIFETKEGRYALDTQYVAKIIPLVNLKKIPKSPDYIAGMFNYHGVPVPVVDLCSLTEGGGAELRMSTRIILVHYTSEDDTPRILGLIAEKVTETIKCTKKCQSNSGVLMDEALYSHTTGIDKEEMVQLFDIKRMIPENIISNLFS